MDDGGHAGWMASSLDGHDFEQAPGRGEGHGNPAVCSSWATKSQT